ncbi:MAG TPA: competence protein CoiA family protein, partial [Anaerolineaceae bacterium]
MRTYKAIHAQTGQEIVILSPQWSRRIDALREMDHADLLVCQGCRQPLRVKAGELKRAHFAHKHLQACSYGSQSLEILEARAVLYDWLLAQFGEQVTVEKQVEGGDLPRPVDCWV